MKEHTVAKISHLLQHEGYEVADCCGIHSAFDIIAKKDDESIILLIKILSNIEALNPKTANDLKRVANVISGFPLVIGDHMKGKKLLNGVVYSRYEISAVNLETFKDIVKRGEFPKIHSIRGNYCVRINPDILSQLRRKFDMTQEELAKELGISKQSVYRYESLGSVSFDIAERIMKIFGENLLIPDEHHFLHQTFHYYEEEKRIIEEEEKKRIPKLKRIVISELQNIGFKISVTHAPFDLVAIGVPKKEMKIFTIVSNDPKGLRRRAEIIDKISLMLHSYKVCISEKDQDVDILVIKAKDLSEITNARELIKLLEEKGGGG